MENIQELLSDAGLKVTTQRIVILRAIIKLNNHPSAEQIYNYIKKKYPTISLSTVYNTLKTFTEKGLLQSVASTPGTSRYDIEINKHHHLFSEDSGRLEDFHDEDLTVRIMDYLKEKEIPGFDIKDVKVLILGDFKNK